jgi:hypothetical protein
LHTPRADDRAVDPSVIKGTSNRDRFIYNPPKKSFVPRNSVEGPEPFPKLIVRVELVVPLVLLSCQCFKR